MKKSRLLIVVMYLVLCAYGASAQRRGWRIERHRPTVYMIAVEQTDSVARCPMQQAVARKNMAAAGARQDFEQTLRTGFQQAHNPQFVFATKDNKFALGIGGYINLRASYDLKGAVDNIDFIPYDIPMQETYANRQRLMMDATTS